MKTKITPQTRALIHALHADGQSDRQIAKHTDLSHTAVAYTLDPAKAPWRRQSAKLRALRTLEATP